MFDRISLKGCDQIRQMRLAGLVVARCLAKLGQMIRPGITTGELDQAAREMLAAEKAESNFFNYAPSWSGDPYPGVSCISVNEVVTHGIPGDRVLAEGDLVSIDFGAIVGGWHGDAARTFHVGAVSDQAAKLSEATREAMWAGIAACYSGKRISDISAAIELSARRSGRYGVVREYTGHGIGTAMHEAPDVPNFGRPGRGAKILKGMVLAIEPMLTLGSAENEVLDDGWTVVTLDGSWAAHWENTVAITEGGLWVLSELDGGEAKLTQLGVPFAPLGD